ncbi:RGM domain family member B [Pontoporia blainvillei]|uniref:RGM domain family member B n=1 Tax=Pontoporia blainvillei TaxID=48723 RepID=A0ABX0S8M0_PONBL|nr:RGM domain family member B [Pontoporia blainvillei]
MSKEQEHRSLAQLPANSAGSWRVPSQPIRFAPDRGSHSDFQRDWVLALPKVRNRLGTRFRRCDWLRRDLPQGSGISDFFYYKLVIGLQIHTCSPDIEETVLNGDCQQPAQCRIQKCTTDFVSLTSHLNSAIDGFDSEFCKALRAYAGCTQRTSKACRGNLVYHSAVLGISDLMSQRNCSKDGPTSSTNPEVTHDPCNYHSHAGAREHRGGDQNPPNYLFCGLFGDPHLRTFKDHFQTCKVEGAWPLIDNNYLSVQVTNVPVVPGSSATATDKASVLFSSFL